MTSKQDYRDSHTAKNYGEGYHKTFKTHAYRMYTWELERCILSNIVKDQFKGGVGSHLDFACGTGRVLTYLEQYCDKSIGVDISESMLEVAKREISNAQLVLGDLTQSDLLQNQRFDLITAFRFFLRAQPSLRNEAISKLAQHLDSDGYLVFNIHNNRTSISNKISKLYTKIKYGKVVDRDEMSYGEVVSLVRSHGLTITATHAYGTYPVFREDQKFPEKLTRLVDRFTKSKYLSTYVIYVCKKMPMADAP